MVELIRCEKTRIAHKPVEREPVRGTYQGSDIVSTSAPIPSGGVHGHPYADILEGYELEKLGQDSADNEHYGLSRPCGGPMPTSELSWLTASSSRYLWLGPTHKAERAERLWKSIELEHATKLPRSSGRKAALPGRRRTQTDFFIMDRAVTCWNTYTLNLAFGVADTRWMARASFSITKMG